jgi:uncharacterized protein YceK
MKRRSAVAALASAAAAAFLLCGCGNIVYRTDREPNRGPYYATCEVADAIGAAFSEPSGPEGGIAQAVCILLLPVTVVSLPCDAAVDTVLLPYDIWAYSRVKKGESK